MKQYTPEFKEQIIKEVSEVGNLSLVCRKHNLRTSTVHTWLHKIKNKDKISESKVNKELLLNTTFLNFVYSIFVDYSNLSGYYSDWSEFVSKNSSDIQMKCFANSILQGFFEVVLSLA